MLRKFKFWYIKWIIGECRHICKICEFRNEEFNTCYEDYRTITFIELLKLTHWSLINRCKFRR